MRSDVCKIYELLNVYAHIAKTELTTVVIGVNIAAYKHIVERYVGYIVFIGFVVFIEREPEQELPELRIEIGAEYTLRHFPCGGNLA